MTISERAQIRDLEREVEELRTQVSAAAAEGPLLAALLRDISERKRIEERLTEAQQWLHMAQDVGEVVAYRYDFATQTLSWSPSAYLIYGIAPETAPSIDVWLGAIHPDDRSSVSAIARSTLERGTDVDQEYRIVRADGSIRWIKDRGRVTLNGRGIPSRLVGLYIDVTDDRRAAEALSRGAARFAALAETTNAILWAVDAGGSFVDRCSSWENFTGQSYEEYRDFGWTDAIHPDDLPRTLKIWNAASAAQIEYTAEYRLRRRDGEYRHVLARAMPVRDSSGHIVEYAGSNIDITDQIATARLIVDREERLRAALAGSGAGTFRWDIRTNALDWDIELDRLFGLPPGQTAPSLDAFIGRVHPDDRPAVVAACERCAAEGADFSQDFRVIWPDGTIHWLYDRGTTYRSQDGQPAYMTGSCIDITDRKVAAKQLEAVVQSITDGFIGVDRDWTIRVFNRAAERHFHLARSGVVGQPFFKIFNFAVGTEFEKVLRTAMRARQPDLRQVDSIEYPGRAIELKAAPTPDGGLAINFSDVTDRRQAERLRELMVGELQHRVKNLLSVVQATAHQTFKAADVPQPVRTIFNDRLAALSRAHDLVLEEQSDTASLEDIVERALAPFAGTDSARIHWSGSRVQVPARSAIAVALAIHELATNAMKYGALSNDHGSVAITWSGSMEADDAFLFQWTESGGPPVKTPGRQGFGTGLIERSLSAELRASVDLSYEKAGFRCTLTRSPRHSSIEG